MTNRDTIVFRSDDAGALLLAIRDTFGPYLAESACLLFTKDGVNRRYIDRDAILNLAPPKRLLGPIVAIIKSDSPEAALARLQLMAAPTHGYGAEPELMTADEAESLIRDADAAWKQRAIREENTQCPRIGSGWISRFFARLLTPPGDR